MIVYEIICWTTGLRYIGATKKDTVTSRITDHRRMRGCTSKYVMEHNNYEVFILEECDNADELKKIEDKHIRHTDCVNYKCEIPNRKETQQKYNTSKKGKAMHKKFRGTEAYKKYLEEYRKTEVYQNYRKKLCEKVKCECGSVVSKQNLNAHYKTKQHQKFIDTILL